MTNYSERLDAVARNAYSGEISWIHDQLDGTSILEEALGEVDKDITNTKAAITSLIKELVAEAKPEEYEDYYASNPVEKGRKMGYNEATREFEQNLLKELEEV